MSRLREIVEAATPGPWEIDGPWWWRDDHASDVITTVGERWVVAVMPPRDLHVPGGSAVNATFMATFDPVVVSALLDVYEVLDAYPDLQTCDEPVTVNDNEWRRCGGCWPCWASQAVEAVRRLEGEQQ